MVSGRNQCYALPELQQWETATTENYVWGDPAAIKAYGTTVETPSSCQIRRTVFGPRPGRRRK